MVTANAIQILILIAVAAISALILLILFRLRGVFGLAPLYITVGVFQPFQVILASTLYVEVLPGYAVSPGSAVLFTASLFAILLIYLHEGALETRKVIYGILLSNLAMSLLMVIFGWQLARPDTLNFLSIPPAIFIQGARVMVAGTVALFADVLLIIFVYQALGRWLKGIPFLRIFITMAVILTLDTLIFAAGAFLGTPLFGSIFSAGVLGKISMSLVLSLALTLYMQFGERRNPDWQAADASYRDIYHSLTYRDRFEFERDRAVVATARMAVTEERFRRLVDLAPDGVLEVDAQGLVVFANEQAQRLFGYRGEELIGQLVEILIPGGLPRLHQGHREIYSRDPQPRPMAHGRPLAGQRKDGSEFPVEVSIGPLSYQGRANTIIMVRDVSERLATQDDLRKRAEEMTALHQMGIEAGSSLSIDHIARVAVELIPRETGADLVLFYQRQDRALQLLAHGPERSAADDPGHADHRVGECLCGLAVELAEPVYSRDIHRDLRCTREECKRHGFRSFAALPVIAAGENLGVLGLASNEERDFSQMDTFLRAVAGTLALASHNAQLHAELRMSAAALEERVLQRTAQLEAAKQRAESADRLKSVFLATMSHELRTPLNSIIGFSGVLSMGLAGELNPEQTKQLGMVRDSAQHLLALINDVLDISKIEAGQIELHLELFSPQQAIENVARICQPLAAKKGLRLEIEVMEGGEVIRSDRRRVEQILLNLLGNAIKFSDSGPIRLSARRREGGLVIEVADHGPGIPHADLERIFEPFSQLGDRSRREGSGLGLAISRNLARLLGGGLSVESEVGMGTRFTFDLPDGNGNSAGGGRWAEENHAR